MWYQNIRSALFGFVTMHASDGETDGHDFDSNTVRCITCSRTVKITETRGHMAPMADMICGLPFNINGVSKHRNGRYGPGGA